MVEGVRHYRFTEFDFNTFEIVEKELICEETTTKEILELLYPHYRVIDTTKHKESGHPDYILETKSGSYESFYIEYKSSGDTLRLNQLKWIFKNRKSQRIFLLAETYPRDDSDYKDTMDKLLRQKYDREKLIKNLIYDDEVLKELTQKSIDRVSEKLVQIWENNNLPDDTKNNGFKI